MTEPRQFPKGWDDQKIKDLLDCYEAQSADEQAGEIESALNSHEVTMMAVPTELEDEVRALISRRQSA
jgi:hypothetical protein